MDRIVEMLLPVASALEDISMHRGGDGNWNIDSRNGAESLLNAITFQFIVAIVVVRHILDLTRPLTLKLQGKEIDLVKPKEEISLLKNALADMRTDIDARHHILYEEGVTLPTSIGVQPSMPRVVQRQLHRASVPAPTPESHYRINLTAPFLGHCSQHLERRFQDEAYSCYKGLYITSSVMLDNLASWKGNIREFCDYYRRDIPNVGGLGADLVMGERLWREEV